ncbi:AarF/ABC1/UbiB kinase family protein [Bacillus sp. OK048]|uniref:ABC1 kinase family protein n=1 Tax=Bacillus sp. OK048 TaxID=1882761 RepID=UPI00087F9454|nr:AarF/UbiB family protein [Bacillus sp. OK048]SDN04821.1 Predicted unusual protein kinase regulating ubiquinone biosynthesis, AarF/ABC1/UbiB family [Bacillus sp. OK048]
MKTRNKLVRMSKVLSMAFVIFLQIYWYKIRRKPQAEWDILWGKIGERYRKTLFELEGLLIKVGQILSTRADLLPKAFISQIEDLTDKVPPSDWSEIEEILAAESLHQKFLSIEKTAVASASIGEVYKGVLLDGTEVAIKVKRPHIDTIVQTDFRVLAIIIWFADHLVPIPKGFINFNVLFKELKEVIERELDYSKELDNILFFQERFKDMDVVQIPSVNSELSTANVLVMEWVDGIRITDVESLENVSRKEIAKRLIQVFLPQWLEPGRFHADPHPGNVLVSKEGKIILLDFGMIGEITKKDAAHFQKLIESFLSKNYSKAVASLAQLGFLLPDAETRTIEKLLAEFASFQPEQLKEMDLLALKVEMNDMIQALPIQVPTRFVFLGRSFVTIEGIIRNLAPEEELIDLGKPVFMEWLNKHGNNKWSLVWQWAQSQPVFKLVHSVTEFLDAPQKLVDLKEIEQRRQFQFTIYENNKKHLFQVTLLGLIGIVAGIYTSDDFIRNLSTGVSTAALIGYLISSHKQKKWMKYMHEKR